HAVTAVQSLAPATDCDDAAGAAAPDNPRREHVDRELVLARTALWMGRAREAADRVAPLLTPAAGFEDAQIEGRTFLVHGSAQRALGHTAAAKVSLRRAILAGSAASDPQLEAQAWLGLLDQIARMTEPGEDGWATGVAAEAAIRRAGDDPRARADLRAELGHLQLADGHPADALEHYEAALHLRQRTLPEDHLAIAESLVSTGAALDAGERSRDAEQRHATALAMRERSLGSSHPLVARALLELGAAQYGDGDLGGAQASFARARLLLDPAGIADAEGTALPGARIEPWPPGARPEHGVALAAVLDRLGIVARSRQRFEEAAKLHGRAAALLESLLGPNDRRLGYPLENLGVALLDLGRPELALPHLRRALAIWDAALGEEHPELAHAHLHLADALVAGRELGEAGAHYQRALDQWEEQLATPEHPLLAYALTGLGRVRLAVGDATAAVEPLERAFEIRKHEREDPINVAETSFLLARALAATGGDQARVLELLRSALDRIDVELPTEALELRRMLEGGDVPGVTDRLVPSGLSLFDRTTAIP
ncbi:MAG TPA: tetratricopeptide repeat protein, partial [Nannocystaceae bacterium]|nr:tetratricopeptide repeat protein [Nannocystaceae bacterium]